MDLLEKFVDNQSVRYHYLGGFKPIVEDWMIQRKIMDKEKPGNGTKKETEGLVNRNE